jgi:hypothetical protein
MPEGEKIMTDQKLKPLRDPNRIIMIDSGKGTGLDMLIGCTFYPTDEKGTYLFSGKHDENLAVVTSGQPFMFEHDGLIWKVPDPNDPNAEPFRIDDELASGSYRNNQKSFAQDDSGTFIAKGSGSGEGGEASASSAGAK